MAKEKFVKDKPHVNIGTIGHVGPRQNNFDCRYHYGAFKERSCRSARLFFN
jgi:hypothetical protein